MGSTSFSRGRSAEAKPTGDESLFKPGAYSGRAKNKDKPGDDTGPSVEEFVHSARVFTSEFQQWRCFKKWLVQTYKEYFKEITLGK